MALRIVKVIPRHWNPDLPWRVHDESGEVDEEIEPDEWLREAVGARPCCFFKAQRSVDGWVWKKRWKPQYW